MSASVFYVVSPLSSFGSPRFFARRRVVRLTVPEHLHGQQAVLLLDILRVGIALLWLAP